VPTSLSGGDRVCENGHRSSLTTSSGAVNMTWGKGARFGNSPSPAITGGLLSIYFTLGW
jgi:hypothetical protein